VYHVSFFIHCQDAHTVVWDKINRPISTYNIIHCRTQKKMDGGKGDESREGNDGVKMGGKLIKRMKSGQGNAYGRAGKERWIDALESLALPKHNF